MKVKRKLVQYHLEQLVGTTKIAVTVSILGELLTGNIITAVFEDVKAKNLKGVTLAIYDQYCPSFLLELP